MITTNVIQRTFFVKIGNMTGTAFTIDRNGRQYLVTARHIAGGAVQSMEVFHNGRWTSLSVNAVGIGRNDVDVAVFAPNVILSPPHLLEATFAGLTYGQPVSFLGFPFDWQGGLAHMNNGFPFPFVKAGIVSAPPSHRIWTDTHGNRGFSGAPVVFKSLSGAGNSPWKVAGIVVKSKPDPQTGGNAGFVIAEPIKAATALMDERPIGATMFGGTASGKTS